MSMRDERFAQPPLEVGDSVIYEGKTYTFPGHIVAETTDGQFVVSAFGSPDGHYKGMKHIYGPSQLRRLLAAEGHLITD